ncbi:60s ribosomal protein l9-1 [Pelomyxa schiedti]|nr:60s ribosomal protein l9-1 [Pelomyxa schiedti]
MRLIKHSSEVLIPDGVKISIKSRHVTVSGPRGKLTKDFSHTNLDIQKVRVGKKFKLVVDMWFGRRKQLAAVRTVCTHIENMITGVTKGYEYKMRFVYAHFPINSSISEDGKELKINNFLGEKVQRVCDMPQGVTVARSEKVKDEIILQGNSIELVSQAAARIHHSTQVKGKDIRKFLDGIYVSEKHVIGE